MVIGERVNVYPSSCIIKNGKYFWMFLLNFSALLFGSEWALDQKRNRTLI